MQFLKWIYRKYIVAILAISLVSPVAAYTVRINGVVFDADSKPTVSVQSAGDLGLDITITGNIDLGEAGSTTAASTNTDTVTTGGSGSSTGSDTGGSATTGSSTGSTTDTSGSSSTGSTSMSPTPSPTPDGTCNNSGRISCFGQDIGPLTYPKGYESGAIVPAGQILAVPFGHGAANSRQQYGFVGHVARTGADAGQDFKVWMSLEPGGKPLPGQYCHYNRIGYDAVFPWNQNKDFRGYCRLPDSKGTVFMNYAACTSSTDDLTCERQDAKFNVADFKIIIFSNVQSY